MRWYVAVFFAALIIHMLHALVVNWSRRKANVRRRLIVSYYTHVPVVIASVVLGIHFGVFTRQLVSPIHIVAGLILGHLVFALSLLLTSRSLRDAWAVTVDIGSIWDFAVDSPAVLWRHINVAVTEELIYRVAAQTLLIRMLGDRLAWLAILIVVAVFWVIHPHFLKVPWAVELEFGVFAVLLGVLYYATNSFILVIVVHTVRNVESAYLDYLFKVDELGDAGKAAEEIERVHMVRRPEQV